MSALFWYCGKALGNVKFSASANTLPLMNGHDSNICEYYCSNQVNINKLIWTDELFPDTSDHSCPARFPRKTIFWREARALSSPKSAVNRTNLGDKRHWQCRKSVFMDTWKQEKTGRHILRYFNYRLVALRKWQGNMRQLLGSGFFKLPDLQVFIPNDKTLRNISSAMLNIVSQNIFSDPFIIPCFSMIRMGMRNWSIWSN